MYKIDSSLVSIISVELHIYLFKYAVETNLNITNTANEKTATLKKTKNRFSINFNLNRVFLHDETLH